MSKSDRYTNAPEEINEALLNAAEIEDFLPPPEQLIPKEETRKITIALSKRINGIILFSSKARMTEWVDALVSGLPAAPTGNAVAVQGDSLVSCFLRAAKGVCVLLFMVVPHSFSCFPA